MRWRKEYMPAEILAHILSTWSSQIPEGHHEALCLKRPMKSPLSDLAPLGRRQAITVEAPNATSLKLVQQCLKMHKKRHQVSGSCGARASGPQLPSPRRHCANAATGKHRPPPFPRSPRAPARSTAPGIPSSSHHATEPPIKTAIV
ncbi:hypothetical protein J6590_027127 [Homalodisca vitripennis]|nr:hypothetical protein J6590_027127 [Homalodisca vitripennis]